MAKDGGNAWKWLLGLGVLGIFVLGGYWTIRQSSVQQPTTASCEVEPYIDLTTNDAINTGTAVSSVTLTYRKNGDFVGTFTSGSSGTKFALGDVIEILMDKANFISKVSAPVKIDRCGSNPHTEFLYATDTATIQIKNSVGDVVTDSATGGATNQSASATNIDNEFKITGNSDQSSGDLVCVFEATNTTEVDDIILSGASKVDVPEFYTLNNANSIAKAYAVKELIDGDSRVYNLRFTPESGQTMGAGGGTAVYTTCYSEQAYKDVDGTFKVGVEDTDATTKYEDTFDYDFLINT